MMWRHQWTKCLKAIDKNRSFGNNTIMALGLSMLNQHQVMDSLYQPTHRFVFVGSSKLSVSSWTRHVSEAKEPAEEPLAELSRGTCRPKEMEKVTRYKLKLYSGLAVMKSAHSVATELCCVVQFTSWTVCVLREDICRLAHLQKEKYVRFESWARVETQPHVQCELSMSHITWYPCEE